MQKFLACFFALFFGCLAANAQVPTLLKDINNDLVSGNPRGMTTAGSTVYFAATDGAHGRELWKTNGTEAFTVLVKDINPNGNSNPANFCNVNGTVFFTATTPENGTELWKTDGTAAGTVMVADLIAGALGSEPSKLTACNGRVFFSAFRRTVLPAGVIMELKLFVSDGTPGGTKVLDPNNITVVGPDNLTAVGNTLFFSASANTIGNELWRTDGSLAGTQLVNNFAPLPNASGNPRNLINVNGNLFLTADNVVNGRQVWKLVPSPLSLTRMTSLDILGTPGVGVLEMVGVNGAVFFSAPFGLPVLSPELFRLNSIAPGGASKIANVSCVGNLTAVNSNLFFTQSPPFVGPILSIIPALSLTATNIRTFDLIPNGESPVPQNLTNVNGTLFFTAATTNEGRELWKSNGALGNTERIQDFVGGPASAGISDLCVRGSDLFFASNGIGGNELRSSNGTLNAIKTIRNIGRAGSFPKEFVRMENITYFSADDGNTGRELWKTDGTTAVTQRVADIISGSEGSNPTNLIVVTTSAGVQTLFFVAKSPNNGRELYKLETTANAVPTRISDIIVGAGDAGIGNLTNLNGRLHFTASSGLAGFNRIFRTNATRTGVEAVTGNLSSANSLTAMGSTLFFTQSPQIGGPQLCKLVNSTVTTVRTFPIINGGEYPIPQLLTVVGTRLFFTAAEATTGRELWVTNSAATDASRISDINPGAGNARIGNMVNFNGTLHFTAVSGLSTGDCIYKTNAGLTGVVVTGGSMQNANNLTVAGNLLFFTQAPQIGGPQLCKLENSTVALIKTFDLIPGGEYPVPQQLTAAVGNNILFTAATANEGRELWVGNGQSAQLVSDIRVGVGNSNISEIMVFGQTALFSADDLVAGQEPWIYGLIGLQGGGSGDRDEISEVVEAPASVTPEIRVYPNPAVNFINVDLPQNELTGTLSIVSASGQLVRSVQSSEGETSIQMDVQDLPKGVYLVRWVQSDDQIVVKKLIVQ